MPGIVIIEVREAGLNVNRRNSLRRRGGNGLANIVNSCYPRCQKYAKIALSTLSIPGARYEPAGQVIHIPPTDSIDITCPAIPVAVGIRVDLISAISGKPISFEPEIFEIAGPDSKRREANIFGTSWRDPNEVVTLVTLKVPKGEPMVLRSLEYDTEGLGALSLSVSPASGNDFAPDCSGTVSSGLAVPSKGKHWFSCAWDGGSYLSNYVGLGSSITVSSTNGEGPLTGDFWVSRDFYKPAQQTSVSYSFDASCS